MTLGPKGSLHVKSFTIITDFTDGRINNYAKTSATVEIPLAAAATAAKSVYHERCFLVNDNLNSLRHSIASKLQLPVVQRQQGRDEHQEFFRRVSRALRSIKSRRTTKSTVVTKAAERPKREAQMEKPMFVTTVRSGVFLEPPPEVAVLLGLRKNGSNERLSNRKLQPAKSTDVVYSFASKPRIVGSTNEPPTPPNGPSVANRKRLFKRQVDDDANRNMCTVMSTAAAGMVDGSIQFGGNTMHDRRVARGSNFASLRFNAPTTENVLSRQAEARRRAAVRQRAQIRARKLRSRTPPPVDGRKHGEMQTDKYLEELTDREMNTSAVGCQADLLPIDDDEDDRFTSSVSNMATPRIDAQTQLDENDLIFPSQSIDDYDEVRDNTVIVSTVNKILKEAILEINAEIEKFQNTKEIISTRYPEPGMNKEDYTIIFTKHELCSLLRNFNAQNEHFDWPILDFEETNYNSLVDDVFEHLRVILTNLDFLANITRKQLELRQIKLSEKSASPPSSPIENLETTRSIKTTNETILDNNTIIKNEEINNLTAAQETDESVTKKNETAVTSDLLDSTKDKREMQEKSNSIINKINAPSVTSDLTEADSFLKSSIVTLEEKQEVDKVDETQATSFQISSANSLFDNAEAIISEPMQSANQDSSIIHDKEESDKKTETETVSELQLFNPPSTEDKTETNPRSVEKNNYEENRLIDLSAEKTLAEETESKNSTMKDLNSDNGINNEIRVNGSEIQQGHISSDSLNSAEIHNHKNEQNISNNFKSSSDQDNEVRPNETSETVPTKQVSDEINVNDAEAEAQDSKPEMKSDLKNEKNHMSNTNQESSGEQQEQSKPTDDNKVERIQTSLSESKLEIKNTEPQPDQMQPLKSDEKKSTDSVNDEVDNFSSEVSNKIKTEMEPSDANDETTIPSNGTEKAQGEISADSEANEITAEAKIHEEEKSLQKLNKEKIEEITSSQTKNKDNLAEEGTHSLLSVDSPPVPQITVEHSEMNHPNEVIVGTETKYENEENQKISNDSNAQLSENNPSNSDAKKEDDSEISGSSQHFVSENITSITNLDDDDDDDDDDEQGAQEVLEKQDELGTATKDEDTTSNDQIQSIKDSVNDTEVNRVGDTSDILQDTTDITNQETVSDDKGMNVGDESSDADLQIEIRNTQSNNPLPDGEMNLNTRKQNNEENGVPKKHNSKIDSSTEKENQDDLDLQNSAQTGSPEDNSIRSSKIS